MSAVCCCTTCQRREHANVQECIEVVNSPGTTTTSQGCDSLLTHCVCRSGLTVVDLTVLTDNKVLSYHVVTSYCLLYHTVVSYCIVSSYRIVVSYRCVVSFVPHIIIASSPNRSANNRQQLDVNQRQVAGNVR